jgi:membrane protease YdiL (CAAX protease family)
MAPDWLGGIILAALVLSVYVSIWLIARWRRGVPLVPYSPRRPVPWHGGDVLMVALVYVATSGLAGKVVVSWLGKPPVVQPAQHAEAVHPVVQLVRGGGWMVAVGFLAAVVVAPIVEEFLFRVVLQGWFEAVERRWRRAMPELRRMAPPALGPILVTAFIFAMMHFRTAAPELPHEYVLAMLIAGMAASLTTMAFAIGLLTLRAGATAADLGWAPKELPGDVRRGLVALVAAAGPLYGLYLALQLLIPQNIASDPIPLFFFALILGVLYHRTHRLAPSLALHVGLNLTSLVLLLAASR